LCKAGGSKARPAKAWRVFVGDYPAFRLRVLYVKNNIAKVLLALSIALAVQGCAARRSAQRADDERIRASTEDRKTWIETGNDTPARRERP
jgi:hypothetical protein